MAICALLDYILPPLEVPYSGPILATADLPAPGLTPLSLEQLHSQFAVLAASHTTAYHGFFPKEGMSRKVFGNNYHFVLGLAPLYLQMAHYGVGTAVANGSFIEHPFERSLMTYLGTSLMLFGDRERSEKTAEYVFKRHLQVHGDLDTSIPGLKVMEYSALDPAAALWVFATLVKCALENYERLSGVLSRDEKEIFYQESKALAALSAVPLDIIPNTYADFEAYYHSMLQSPYLTVTPKAKDAMEKIVAKISDRVRSPLLAMAVHRLPEKIRTGFGLTLDRDTITLSYQSEIALKAGQIFLPSRLRRSPLESLVRTGMNKAEFLDQTVTDLIQFAQALGLEMTANQGRAHHSHWTYVLRRTIERYNKAT